MFPPPPPDQVKQTPRSGPGPGSINGFVLVIGFFHNTPAAAHPKLVTYFALVSQSHCSLFSVIGGRRCKNLAISYHCFMLVEENCLGSAIVTW
jgi:hypothetical protein